MECSNAFSSGGEKQESIRERTFSIPTSGELLTKKIFEGEVLGRRGDTCPARKALLFNGFRRQRL